MEEKVCNNTTVEFMVSGPMALFSDILTRSSGEKTSYPVPTYEALKGMLHSVYWKPTIIWYIDDVRIMNKIRYYRRGMRPINYGGGNGLAYYTYLDDVCYQVRAHFEWNLNRPELAKDRNRMKHLEIAKKMIERGGRRDVFMGIRECQAYVEPCVFGSGTGAYDGSGTVTYGLMEHGLTYADEAIRQEDKGMLSVRLWQPEMTNGVIHFIRPEECTIVRHIKTMGIKPFGIDEQDLKEEVNHELGE